MIKGMNGTTERKQLIRPQQGRMVAGVCAGIGDYIGLDANIVRLLFAVPGKALALAIAGPMPDHGTGR